MNLGCLGLAAAPNRLYIPRPPRAQDSQRGLVGWRPKEAGGPLGTSSKGRAHLSSALRSGNKTSRKAARLSTEF